jgi:hypothetical protein
MLRPIPVGPIPPETARIARAAFPQGNRYLRVADELETLFTDDAFLALFPTHGQPALPPGGWRWPPSCNSPKGSLIAKQRMPCAAASTGNMCRAWSSQTLGLTLRSSVNFAADCWQGRRRPYSLIRYSRGVATANSSKRGVGSAWTLHTYSPRCVP